MDIPKIDWPRTNVGEELYSLYIIIGVVYILLPYQPLVVLFLACLTTKDSIHMVEHIVRSMTLSHNATQDKDGHMTPVLGQIERNRSVQETYLA